MKTETLGEWAFLACILIAVLAGLAVGAGVAGVSGYTGSISALLVVLGVVVGLTTVTEKETTPFLVAAVALIVAGSVGFVAVPWIGSLISAIVGFIGVFVAPAAVIIAVKAVYALASRK